jgi:hypothetical protein
MVVVDATLMQLSLALSQWTRRHNPVTPAEMASLWVQGRFADGTLDQVPFSHSDFRDLRGQMRLCFSGYPALARAVYTAHRKEHARRHRFWRAMHPPEMCSVHPDAEAPHGSG